MNIQSQNKPNIILILSDDQGEWAMGCSGNSEIMTPNLDRLAAEGMRFTNFFCASPVCSPARASILTGMIPSQHGVHDWIKGGNTKEDSYRGVPLRYLDGYETYTEKLSELGYTCGITGKWHLGDSMTPQHGFTHWHVIERGGSDYHRATFIDNGSLNHANEYITDTITDDAVKFIQENSQEPSPFYLSVHYTAPHSPWGKKQHPAEIYNQYADCKFHSVPNEPIHAWQINTCEAGFNQKSRHKLLSGYYTAVSAMDQGIGKILDTLDELGIREETLIIFTSDNGMSMGHHGIWGKGNGTYPQNMYDSSVKVPTIISKPGEIPQAEICADLLSHYDIKPTLLAYLGIAAEPDHLPGTSFLPLLQGKQLDENRRVVVFDEYGPVRMIRTKEWKYISRFPDGPDELYDLVQDPNEEVNLVDDQANENTCQNLVEELNTWFEKYVDPKHDGLKAKVFGRGQLAKVQSDSDRQKVFADDYFFTAKIYRLAAFLFRLIGQK